MKYALLIYDDPQAFAQMDEATLGAVYEGYGKFSAGLAEHDLMRGGEQLSLTSVTTVEAKNGKTVTTDGPFAETKEQLAGFYVIECDSLDQALEAAADIPSVKYGGKIEVRPVVEQSPS
ncbi:MAG: hypothetical protein QOH26_745 [Actinomycetota bacterium]|jgi:hypothetical protein|nr:hypothetical protein [Actinomycetota bacterium]